VQVHYLSTPNYEQAYGFLGMIYEIQGQFDEAAATRQKSCRRFCGRTFSPDLSYPRLRPMS
jgi:hypothetical protein